MSTQRKKKFDLHLVGRVLSFTRPYRYIFIASIFLGAFMALLAPLRPYLIQLTVNKCIDPGVSLPQWVVALLRLVPNDLFGFIVKITVFQIGMLLFETMVRFLFSFFTARLGQQVVCDLREKVYEKILGLNLRQFDTTPIGTLTTRTINDIESINDIFSDGLVPILADFLTILATLFAMFSLNWKTALVSLLPFPFLILATYYFKESVNASFNHVRNAVAALNTFVQEHITGIHLVQAFSAEAREMKKFEAINASHRDANIEAIFAYSVFFPVVELVLAISSGLLVWWVAGNRLDAGILIAFILYLNQIFRPLRIIADKFNVLQMGMIAAERVFKMLDNTDVATDTGHIGSGEQNVRFKGAVDFKDVVFSYLPNVPVLRGIGFSIQPGQTIALVGPTGSGKTSIISLISRLYAIDSGEIRIDGLPLEEYALPMLRKNIGVVLQDVFLFSGSIMDNLTLRNPLVSEALAMEAAKTIGIHDFIMGLPGGYAYNVMERGGTLSLGQRQLLSFARALLYDPSILILDEATSSIDNESEVLLQLAVEKVIQGRTSIVIAHRLSTIRKADKIIVLEKGRIVESGDHSYLMTIGGKYKELVETRMKQAT